MATIADQIKSFIQTARVYDAVQNPSEELKDAAKSVGDCLKLVGYKIRSLENEAGKVVMQGSYDLVGCKVQDKWTLHFK